MLAASIRPGTIRNPPPMPKNPESNPTMAPTPASRGTRRRTARIEPPPPISASTRPIRPPEPNARPAGRAAGIIAGPRSRGLRRHDTRAPAGRPAVTLLIPCGSNLYPSPRMEKLKLSALDADDLSVISAAIQDSLVAVRDCVYFAGEKRFVLLLNRFC